MKQPPPVIQHWIESVQTEASNLTKWESDFIDSIAEQFESRGSVSEKQQEILERIYAEKTK